MYRNADEDMTRSLAPPKIALPPIKILIIVLSLLALYAGAILSQIQINDARSGYSRVQDMKYLPSGQFLKGAALAYDELFADFLWIKALVYFGEQYQSRSNYEWLYHLLDTVTTLDPFFQYPYEFGGVALAYWIKNVDLSIKILKKGMINVPKTHERYWAIPFYLGFNYMFYKKDYKIAARYLEEASKYPGHPRYLPFLVARLYANAKDPDIALHFLREIYNSTKNKKVKEDLLNRMKEIIVERDIQNLEQARDQHKKKTGSYPTRLEDLVAAGLLTNIPAEPFGGKYIMKKDYSIHSTIIKERMKLFVP